MKTAKRILIQLLALWGIASHWAMEDYLGQKWILHRGKWLPVPMGGAPSGDSDTGSLPDSLPTIVASARQVREQVGMNFPSSVDRRQLPMGTGRSWREIDIAKITAQDVPEGTTLDNPQQLVDTLISVEPTIAGVHIVVTPELAQYVSKNVAEQWGSLMQNALERRKDRNGLNLYDGATVTGGGTGTTLNSGVVSAMVAQIQGDTDESALETEEVFFFAHGFQIHDVRSELASGVGTYPLPAGLTAEAFARGQGVVEAVGGAVVRRNNNVRIDSTPDGHGGVHARSGVVLVEVTGKQRAFTKMLENQAGAQAMWLYDWFGYLERSAGNLLKRILTDATAPTTG
jgi:hypothetical protein